MSCDAAALALSLHLAGWRPDAEPVRLVRAVASAPPRPAGDPSGEPLFTDIVAHAGRLKREVTGWRARAAHGWAWTSEDFNGLRAQATALAALDMQGHLALAKRGTDGDLKCILRGLSQDIPRRLDEMAGAGTTATRTAALDELLYLLRDNVDVVTTPERTNSEAVAG